MDPVAFAVRRLGTRVTTAIAGFTTGSSRPSVLSIDRGQLRVSGEIALWPAIRLGGRVAVDGRRTRESPIRLCPKAITNRREAVVRHRVACRGVVDQDLLRRFLVLLACKNK